MQPANRNERKKAFLNFLGLLLVCLLLIITTVYFSVQIPFRQNDILINTNTREMEAKKREHAFSDRFLEKFTLVSNDLDSINTSNRPELLESQIVDNNADLNKIVSDADSGIYNRSLYTAIVNTLEDFRRAKKIIRGQTQKNLGEENLQTQLEAKDKELMMARDSLRIYIANYNKLRGISN